MESNGISVMAAILLVDNHALTVRLRIKNTTEGCTHYVVSVYDPNVKMLYAALVMSVVALLVPQREIDWQPTVFWALAYSAILATALAWSLWLFVLKNLPASIASLSTLAVPVCFMHIL